MTSAQSGGSPPHVTGNPHFAADVAGNPHFAAPTSPSPGTVLAGRTEPLATHDDGLHWPRDFNARRGVGHRRGLVLGGGGIYFVAWQIAYLRELKRHGVDLPAASIMVGTSAGSVVAALSAAGKLDRAARQLEALSKVPLLVNALAPSGGLNPSQQRALDVFSAARDDHPDTIRAIGFAALAADAVPPAKIRRAISLLMPSAKWPSKALHITTVDAYTGERLVVRASSGVPVAHAAAASSSVPGIFSPQPVLDRRCMDGGVSGSGINSDVVAGAERVVILALGAGRPGPEPVMTIAPDSVAREREALEAAGTQVVIKGPVEFTLAQLMSPLSTGVAMKHGTAQAREDAAELAELWHG